MDKKPEKVTEAETTLDIVIRDLDSEVNKDDDRQKNGRFTCLRWIYCI